MKYKNTKLLVIEGESDPTKIVAWMVVVIVAAAITAFGIFILT